MSKTQTEECHVKGSGVRVDSSNTLLSKAEMEIILLMCEQVEDLQESMSTQAVRTSNQFHTWMDSFPNMLRAYRPDTGTVSTQSNSSREGISGPAGPKNIGSFVQKYMCDTQESIL